MRRIGIAAWLACRDWLYELTLSVCAVLALASMLGPLLVLEGVKNGVINGMRERLLEDPAVLVITPTGSAPEGGYPASFVEKLATLPGARFAVGRTRDIATDITLTSPKGNLTVGMEPCAPGEPVLEHYKMPEPKDGEVPEIVLATPAAQGLGVAAGATVTAALGRRTPEGRLESVTLTLRVVGVLPPDVSGRKLGFLPLSLLGDMQDYRDYIAVPKRGYTGRTHSDGERRYASFRLYAQNLDSVEGLTQALTDLKVESRTSAREIASIRVLETAISRVILVISLAVGAGFIAYTISSVQGSVRRKDKMLAMLRLLGLSRLALVAYPLVQTLLTSLCGTLLAGVLYLCVSLGIDSIFAAQGQGMKMVHLSVAEYAIAMALTVFVALIAAAVASVRGTSIEPSAVLREI